MTTCSVEGCERTVLARGWCGMHYQREAKKGLTRLTESERFWAKVQKTETCWLWTGANGANGYGQIRIDGRAVLAHRWVHERLLGPIPDGFEIDHLCRVPACVNPAHLEAVTPWENNSRSNSNAAVNARKTHCIWGHPYDTENTYINRKGHRKCRACARERGRVGWLKTLR